MREGPAEGSGLSQANWTSSPPMKTMGTRSW